MRGTPDWSVAPEQRWWSEDSVAVVTGANKGIGFAAGQLIAQSGLRTVVAARDEGRGQDAVTELKRLTGSDRIAFEQLDISDAASAQAFAKRVAERYGKVHVLLNNAGIAFKGNTFGADEAKQTIDCNYRGTRAVCEALLPLLPPGGRIVNVCSMAGKQRIIRDPALLRRFQEAQSPEDVDRLADEFVASIRDGSFQAKGWPGSMYGVSKLCEATYTRVLAAQHPELQITACCPGYVNTDMSSGRGTKTPLQGADTPVWLALLAPPGSSGKFFSERREESF